MGIYTDLLTCGCVMEWTSYDYPPSPPYYLYRCRRHRLGKWFKDLISGLKEKKIKLLP